MKNENLKTAKAAKNDEFYTQFSDIEKEILVYLKHNPNAFKGKTVLLPCDDPEWSNFTKFLARDFERLGLKKLISTSFVKPNKFEGGEKGKVYTLTHNNHKRTVDINSLKWRNLTGNGDFRSEEITKLRDEADIIITNPPFSLFREFMAWIVEGNTKFLVIGNINAITYKEIFPLIKENKIWIGATGFNEGMYFRVPAEFIYAESYKFDRNKNGHKISRVPGVCWFTNLEHGRRHQPLGLSTKAQIERHSQKLKTYDNYEAIDIPKVKWIPSDHPGIMGVPITFLDKYCPEQFEIVGSNRGVDQDPNKIYGRGSYLDNKETYKRIFIKHQN